MSATEIILIVIGAVIFLLGYLMPAGRKDTGEEAQAIGEGEISKMVDTEIERAKGRIEDIVDETVNYSIERAERAMERVANEKVMAVGEYSDTVLEEINKNHKEVVFLYDMLNDKHDNLMSTINEATVTADQIKQTAKDAEITAAEAQNTAHSALQEIEDARDSLAAYADAAYRQDAADRDWDDGRAAYGDADSAPLQVTSAELLGEGSSRYPEQTAAAEDAGAEAGPAIVSEEAPEEAPEEQNIFKPIAPRRVEIIHREDGDYAAPDEEDMSTSEAFASMGFFHPGEDKADKAEGGGRKTRGRKNAARKAQARADENEIENENENENAPGVELRFDHGKKRGRNSNERILELHKAGKSNMAIAKELGLGLGEVKLVIDLFEGM